MFKHFRTPIPTCWLYLKKLLPQNEVVTKKEDTRFKNQGLHNQMRTMKQPQNSQLEGRMTCWPKKEMVLGGAGRGKWGTDTSF